MSSQDWIEFMPERRQQSLANRNYKASINQAFIKIEFKRKLEPNNFWEGTSAEFKHCLVGNIKRYSRVKIMRRFIQLWDYSHRREPVNNEELTCLKNATTNNFWEGTSAEFKHCLVGNIKRYSRVKIMRRFIQLWDYSHRREPVNNEELTCLKNATKYNDSQAKLPVQSPGW